MSCDVSALKCLNAIYKYIVNKDKERYEPEMFDLFKMTERILDNPVLAAEICKGMCVPIIVDPPPLPVPEYVDMAYFRNYEQNNTLSGMDSTDIVVTDIDSVEGRITVNFIPLDVRSANYSADRVYVLNRDAFVPDDNAFEGMQLYIWPVDELIYTNDDPGGKFALDLSNTAPYISADPVLEDIFHIGDRIAFMNPMTILGTLYPYAPIIDKDEQQ